MDRRRMLNWMKKIKKRRREVVVSKYKVGFFLKEALGSLKSGVWVNNIVVVSFRQSGRGKKGLRLEREWF